MGRVLVTGGTGFLGRHLVQLLLDGGAEPGEIRVLCRRGDRDFEEAGLDVVEASVTDREAFVAAAEGCELVFHLAGKVDRKPDALGHLMSVHVEGTRNAVHAAAAAEARRLVYVSTSGTIGVSKHKDFVADEHDPYPLELVREWPYYLSKVYAEQTALETAEELGVELVVINPTLLLGPGDDRNSSTGDVLKFLRRQIPAIPSGGMSFVDARDAAAATLAAADKGRPGERYLLTAENWPIEKFLRRLESISGVEGPSLKVPDRLGRWTGRLIELGYDALGREAPMDKISVEMSQHFWYVNADKARRELGFDPRRADDTLQDTVDDLKGRYAL